MNTKLLFNTIDIGDQTDPVYIPKTGTIIDKNIGTVLYKFPELEITNFFYFKIEFATYQYTSYYLPKTGGYQNRMSKRVYHLYLYLNMNAIIGDHGMTKSLYKKLAYYLTILQMREFEEKKSYYTHKKNISHFINYRELNYMYLIPWYCYRINNKFVFDLKQKKIISSNQIKKINFMRKGGIIETNNVTKLINDNFKPGGKSITPNTLECTDRKTLVILPSSMTNLWPNATILVYDKLLSLTKSEINYYKQLKINQIIIHECHVQFLFNIKNLVNNLECNRIWIINSLPLRYYFSLEKTPNKLTVNEIATISNLWLNFTINNKKKYKTEMIRLYLSKFNQYYTVVNYEPIHQIQKLQLSMVPFEKYIYSELNKYYENWKNMLTNDIDNIYSFTTKTKNNRIETKIFSATITLITSVVGQKNIKTFFEKTIKDTLTETINIYNRLDNFFGIYEKKINNLLVQKNNIDVTYFNDLLENVNGKNLSILKNKKETINIKILNYQRYLNGNIYQTNNDDSCPICYSDENLVKTKLICGHSVCLECLLHTLRNSNKCPICNEFVNIQKIAIIRETIYLPCYSSNIINYIKKLDNNTVILTNLYGLDNVIEQEQKIKIINITKNDVSNEIKRIKNLDTVVIFTTQEHSLEEKTRSELQKIINYFLLFDIKPKIYKIDVIF